MSAHAQSCDLFVQDLIAGADERLRLPTRVVTEFAWHSLFIRNLLIRPTVEMLDPAGAAADDHRSAVVPGRPASPRQPNARR